MEPEELARRLQVSKQAKHLPSRRDTAIMRFYSDATRMAMSVARRMGFPPDALEEFVNQASGLWLVQAVDDFDPGRNVPFTQFFWKRLYGKALDARQKFAKKCNREVPIIKTDQWVDEEQSVEEIEKDFRQRAFRRAFRRLPRDDRALLAALYSGRYTTRSLGKKLGVTAQTISRWSQQAREYLRILAEQEINRGTG